MKWTKKEQALIDLLKPAYITRDDEKGCPVAVFWREEPTLKHGNYYGGGEIAGINLPLFKRIREGKCVKVDG